MSWPRELTAGGRGHRSRDHGRAGRCPARCASGRRAPGPAASGVTVWGNALGKICLVGGSFKDDTQLHKRHGELSYTNAHKHDKCDHAVFTFFDFLLGLFEFMENHDHHLARVRRAQRVVLRAILR